MYASADSTLNSLSLPSPSIFPLWPPASLHVSYGPGVHLLQHIPGTTYASMGHLCSTEDIYMYTVNKMPPTP